MEPPVTPSNDKIAESRKKAESRKIRRLEDARKLRTEAHKSQTEADQWRAEALSQERGLKKKREELPAHEVRDKEQQIAQMRIKAKMMERKAEIMARKAKQLIAPEKKLTQKDVLPPSWASRRKPRVRFIY